MPLRQPLFSYNVVCISVFLILLYFVGFLFSAINYTLNFRGAAGFYGSDLVNAHLVFCIIGGIVFFLFTTGFWIFAARFVRKPTLQVRFVVFGFWSVFLFKDLPLFVIEYVAFFYYGHRSSFQHCSFIIQTLYFSLSFVVTWLSITYMISTLLEKLFGVGWAPGDSLEEKMEACLMSPSPQALMLSDKRNGSPGREDLYDFIHSHDCSPGNSYRHDAGLGCGATVGVGLSLSALPARVTVADHLGICALGAGCGLCVDFLSDCCAREGRVVIHRDVVLQAQDVLRHVSTFFAICESNPISRAFRQKHEWLVMESHSQRYYVVQKNPATGDVLMDVRTSLRAANDVGLLVAGRPAHTGEIRQRRMDMEFDLPSDLQVAYMIAWLRKEDPRWSFSTENSRQFTTRARYALNDF